MKEELTIRADAVPGLGVLRRYGVQEVIHHQLRVAAEPGYRVRFVHLMSTRPPGKHNRVENDRRESQQ